ncbi:MAG: DinB family protein [Chloroflexi bacterium CFX7]|nr:DinB family protein [Chloroflexi bacterium CFX7]RIL03640.1 MAG: hypothetical protein DCC78_02485 [bacterium]
MPYTPSPTPPSPNTSRRWLPRPSADSLHCSQLTRGRHQPAPCLPPFPYTASMLSSIAGFLHFFAAVNRRAVRDIAALPPAADGWAPATGEGEKSWSINKLIGHMAGSRLYFASAYRGEGWISPRPPDISRRDLWVLALDESARRFHELLKDTPDEWLHRKIQMIDSDGALSGWRILMMMTEHDIHHRSQIDTYAGLNGWDVPQIFDRSAETIGARQAGERTKHGLSGPGNPL